MIPIIKVNDEGYDATGENYLHVAADHIVAAGYMINVPTLIQFPSGKVETGNLVKITPSGMDYLRREFADFSSR